MAKELLDNRKEIELAEGISVYLHPAGLAPRVLARIIDWLIVLLITIVINVIVWIIAIVMGSEVAGGLLSLFNFLIYWGYDLFFELGKKSATPGKRAMKLKVVKLSGAPTDLSSSFLRALLVPIDFLLLLPGMIAVLLSQNSQRLGDMAGGTVVIHSLGEVEHSPSTFSVEPLRPRISLTREEQLAFVEYGRRYDSLSHARQAEIVDCFQTLKGTAADARAYALGITTYLSRNEE